MWEPQADAFRGSHRVVAPDMRGHGSSDIPSFVATIRRMADDVRALVAALELAPVVLVGQGLGGHVVLDYAGAHPDEVRGLVLVGIRTKPDDHSDEEDRYRTLQALRSGGPAAFASAALPELLSPAGAEPAHELVAKIRRIVETTSAAGIASALAAMASRPDARDGLASLAVTTLFVAGAGIPGAVEDGEAAAAANPAVRLSVVEGAARLPSVEQSDAFTTALKDFLAALPADESPTSTEKPLSVLPKLLPGLLRA
jgi:pimeloyl-ACP methyl ester carboxylesterase